MSAVTVAVLDRHLAAVTAALQVDQPLRGGVRATVLVRYRDALGKAPRAVVVGHLLRTAARVARVGVAEYARTWRPKAVSR